MSSNAVMSNFTKQVYLGVEVGHRAVFLSKLFKIIQIYLGCCG